MEIFFILAAIIGFQVYKQFREWDKTQTVVPSTATNDKKFEAWLQSVLGQSGASGAAGGVRRPRAAALATDTTRRSQVSPLRSSESKRSAVRARALGQKRGAELVRAVVFGLVVVGLLYYVLV